MTLSAPQKDLLEAKLATQFVPHLPALLAPKNANEDARKNLSRALSALALSAICEIDAAEACTAVVDDYDDYGLDAIYYHANADTLYLVQGKLKAASTFSQEEANGFAQGIRKVLRQDFSGLNANILSMQTAIEGALESCSRIELVVIHIGSGVSAHGDAALKQLISEERPTEERLSATYQNFDAGRVAAYLHDSGAYARVDAALHVKAASSRNEGRKTYIGFSSIDQLVALHRRHGKALFAKNIRQHLGHKTDVNDAIRVTLETRPAEFEYLNNGVTILAERIDPKNNKADVGKRLVLTGLSVINGAQTVASSAGFVADNPDADISSAYVPVTIIQADLDNNFSKRVTRARNHQNPVLVQNFAALDDEQERLRRELALLGVAYIYKPEGYDGAADPNRIRIEEAAQALAIAHLDPRFPAYLKREPGQLLMVDGPYYRELFNAALTAHRLINAVRLYRYISARMAAEERGSGPGPERLTYKHGAYAIGYILAKRVESVLAGAALINPAQLSAALSTPFDEARQSLWSAVEKRWALTYRGPLAMMRNVGEALPILAEAMVAHYGLEDDPVLPHKSRFVAGEPYQKALFQYLAERAPQIGGLT